MNIIETIREWNRKRKEHRKERKIMKSMRYAESCYQVREYNKEIWLIYQGQLVCPMDMFKLDSIAALHNIRELYVLRDTTTM